MSGRLVCLQTQEGRVFVFREGVRDGCTAKAAFEVLKVAMGGKMGQNMGLEG